MLYVKKNGHFISVSIYSKLYHWSYSSGTIISIQSTCFGDLSDAYQIWRIVPCFCICTKHQSPLFISHLFQITEGIRLMGSCFVVSRNENYSYFLLLPFRDDFFFTNPKQKKPTFENQCQERLQDRMWWFTWFTYLHTHVHIVVRKKREENDAFYTTFYLVYTHHCHTHTSFHQRNKNIIEVIWTLQVIVEMKQQIHTYTRTHVLTWLFLINK